MKRPSVEVRALRPSDWPALEALFGARGACGGCWCMAWRLERAAWEAGRGEGHRRAFKRLVEREQALGAIALADDCPEGRAVGWCSVGPRADFVALEAKRSLATDWDERTWSVTCFFVAKDWRKCGLGKRLLEVAVALAKEHHATRLEGYPVLPPKAGGELPAAFAWTGLPRVFERCGFKPLAKTPGKRPIYVRALARR
ncbi:MAG: GNAT family N-acetyltransferase [Planctomycetes bacterium]|nr:GNAT family N-acetyltransferase [Planctomycetota bacterium]